MKISIMIGIRLWVLVGGIPIFSCPFAQAEASSGDRKAETFESLADRSSGNSSRKSSSESALEGTDTRAISSKRGLLSNIFLRDTYSSASYGENDEKQTFLRVTESSMPIPNPTTSPTISESTAHTHINTLSGFLSSSPTIVDETPTESPAETTKLSTKPTLFPTKMPSPLPAKSPTTMPSMMSTGELTKQTTMVPTISNTGQSTITTTIDPTLSLSSTASMTPIDRPRRQTIEPGNELVSETTIELISAFQDGTEIEKVEKGIVDATTRILHTHRENTAKPYNIASVIFPEDCSIGFEGTDDGAVCYRVVIFVMGGQTKQAIGFLKEKVEMGDFEEILNSNGFDSSIVSEKSGELRMSEIQLNFKLDEAESRNDIFLAVDELDIGSITEAIEDAAVEILKDEDVCFEEASCGIVADVIPGKCWNQMYDLKGTKVGNICYRLGLIFITREGNDERSDFMLAIEKSITDGSLEDVLEEKQNITLILISESHSPTIDPSVSPAESPSSSFFPTKDTIFDPFHDFRVHDQSMEPSTTPSTTSSKRPVNMPEENENDLASSKSVNSTLVFGAIYLIILFCIAMYLITLIVFIVRSG